jgi:hypothetical protein
VKEEFLHHSPPGSDYLGQASCELAIKAACSIPKGGGSEVGTSGCSLFNMKIQGVMSGCVSGSFRPLAGNGS